MLCCAGTYKLARPHPRAAAKATRTLSPQGDWEWTPLSQPRVAEVQSAPAYWIAAGKTPSDVARRHASSLPAHSVAQGLAAPVMTPEATVARTPAASATSAP